MSAPSAMRDAVVQRDLEDVQEAFERADMLARLAAADRARVARSAVAVGWSAVRVGAVLGVSRQRVHQLINDGGAR